MGRFDGTWELEEGWLIILGRFCGDGPSATDLSPKQLGLGEGAGNKTGRWGREDTSGWVGSCCSPPLEGSFRRCYGCFFFPRGRAVSSD